MFEIIIVVCKKITSEDGGCYIATDKFYTTLDNVYMFSIKLEINCMRQPGVIVVINTEILKTQKWNMVSFCISIAFQ